MRIRHLVWQPEVRDYLGDRRTLEYNIKSNSKETGFKVWVGIIWLRIGFSGSVTNTEVNLQNAYLLVSWPTTRLWRMTALCSCYLVQNKKMEIMSGLCSNHFVFYVARILPLIRMFSDITIYWVGTRKWPPSTQLIHSYPRFYNFILNAYPEKW
jgi:hypothetical protein